MAQPIIVGFDGSDNACDALVLGQALASTLAASLLVIVAYTPEQGESLGTAPRMDEDRRKLVLDRAADILGDSAEAELRTVPLPSAAAALHLQAEQEGAQMIVVGSSHRSLVGRVLVGAVTQEVLDASPCAVAVAPAALRLGQVRCSNVGVGFDDSATSHDALALASRLASRAGGELRLIWAADLGAALPPDAERVEPDYLERSNAELELTLARVAEDLDEERMRVTSELVRGDAVEALVRESASLDLLVLGSRGYGPVRRVLLGSVSRRVVDRSACPVIIVPRTAAAPDGATPRLAPARRGGSAGAGARRPVAP